MTTPTTARDRDLLAEAEHWLRAAVPADAQALLLVGAGLGHAIDLLEHRQPRLRIAVLEPDAAVADAFRARRDWSSLTTTGRLALVVGPDYAGLSDVARRFPGLSSAPTLVYPPLADSRPADVARAREAVQRLQFGASANDQARKASAGRYLVHTLANAPRIARSGDVAALGQILAGIPAVVAAAGPSLDRNIHDLGPVADRAVLIACDTAARPLMTAGLDPDFVVASDPSRANAAHLSSLGPSESWLVAEGSLHPSAFAHFDHKTFMFKVSAHEPWPWLGSLGLDRGRLETWGSVATSALSLAVALGCDPIVLAGADFAFTGGRPYCRGTSFESMWSGWVGGGTTYDEIWRAAIDRWPETIVTDIHGHPARTAPHLVAFRDWIAERAAALGDRHVVNATGAGILTGTRIAQQMAMDALGPLPPRDRAARHAQIRRAHTASRGHIGRLFSGISDVLAGRGADPRPAWIAFSGGGTTPAALDAALRSHEYDAWSLGQAHALSAKEIP